MALNPTAQEFRPTTTPFLMFFYSFPPLLPLINPSLIQPQPQPTRALQLTYVPTHVSESTIRRELEVFGDVRAVQMERLRDGIVTVHFYDIRQAIEALNKIQEQHYMQQQRRLGQHVDHGGLTLLCQPARGLICGRVIWAQFGSPVAVGIPDGYNQGNVVITLDSNVSTATVRNVFEAFGDVKEIRETPSKKHQKIVEFYDTRDAGRAIAAVNGQQMNGKNVVVEFNHHIGHNHLSYKQDKPNIIIPNSVREVQQPTPCKAVEYDVVRDDVNNVDSKSLGGGLKKYVKCLYKNKPWKGSRFLRERSDERFLIKDNEVISSHQESRTTVMIKNIPNKYSQKLLLNMLDNHCIQCNEGNDQLLSSYDFVYLPIDFVNKCNVGYGFVNMTSPEGAWRLHKAFNHQNWEVFNSKKICEVSYARLQGLEVLKQHFKNSKFLFEAKEYMPVVFTPPRDGRTLTEPIPIVGRNYSSSTSSSMSSEVIGCHDARSCSDSNNHNLHVEDTQSDSTSVGGGD